MMSSLDWFYRLLFANKSINLDPKCVYQYSVRQPNVETQ